MKCTLFVGVSVYSVDVELVEQCRISVMALVVVLGLWHRLLWVNMDLLVLWDQVG